VLLSGLDADVLGVDDFAVQAEGSREEPEGEMQDRQREQPRVGTRSRIRPIGA
jgi:hypothetical protein